MHCPVPKEKPNTQEPFLMCEASRLKGHLLRAARLCLLAPMGLWRLASKEMPINYLLTDASQMFGARLLFGGISPEAVNTGHLSPVRLGQVG